MTGPDDDDKKSAVIIPWPGKRPGDGGDAFDEAVRRATEPVAATPGTTKEVDVEALAARVVSAVTGVDGATALATVRNARDNVIDLQAARAARKDLSDASGEASERLKAAMKAAFGEFMRGVPARGGEVVIDGQFLRAHGSALLGTLFKALASAVTQPQPANTSTQETRDDTRRDLGPSVRVDLGNILGSLFRRRPPEG